MNENTATAETEVDFPADTYAIVEIMGHDRIAGRIAKVGFGGAALLRVDVAEIPETAATERAGEEEDYDYSARHMVSRQGKYVRDGMPARAAFTKLFGGSAIFSMRLCSAREAEADELSRYDLRPRERFQPDEPRALAGGAGTLDASDEADEVDELGMPL